MNNRFEKSSKILIVSSWAPPSVGGPQHLYNTFSQFPQESYVILTGYIALLRSKVDNAKWLNGDYYFYDHAHLDEKHIEQSRVNPIIKHSRLVQFFQKILQNASLPIITVAKILMMTYSGYLIIYQNKIGQIMAVSDHGPSLISSYILSRLTKKPMTVYLFDIYRGNNLHFLDKFLAWCFESAILQHARLILVTNDGTKQLLTARYMNDRKIEVVYNSTFTSHYALERTKYRPKPPYIILYTGHVYWAQQQSIMNLIQAMDLLQDMPIELHLYIPKANATIRAVIENKNNIKLTSASQSEMPKIQSQATLLFLPLSWNTSGPDIIRTATPGKLTDYLASGRPMLVHAPKDAYVSQYVRERKLGLVVDQNNVQQLANAIRAFLLDPSHGQLYIDNSLNTFTNNHDAVKNAKKLMRFLNINYTR